MLRRMIVLLLILAVSSLAGCNRDAGKSSTPVPHTAVPDQGAVLDGALLFKQYCAGCHPDGGNVTDPKRPLYGSALRANRITTPEDIIKIMRNPISRMIRFDPAMLPDREARAIAEYVLKAFK